MPAVNPAKKNKRVWEFHDPKTGGNNPAVRSWVHFNFFVLNELRL